VIWTKYLIERVEEREEWEFEWKASFIYYKGKTKKRKKKNKKSLHFLLLLVYLNCYLRVTVGWVVICYAFLWSI